MIDQARRVLGGAGGRAGRCPNRPERMTGAPNERVLLDEFEKAVVAEAELFGLYADAFSGRSTASPS